MLLQSVTTPFSIIKMKPYHFIINPKYVGANFWVNLDTIQTISDLVLYENLFPEEYRDNLPYASFNIQFAFQDKLKHVELISHNDKLGAKEGYKLSVQEAYDNLVQAWKTQ